LYLAAGSGERPSHYFINNFERRGTGDGSEICASPRRLQSFD
jgi:hypothetical protein